MGKSIKPPNPPLMACPYCRQLIDISKGGVSVCTNCGLIHHQKCAQLLHNKCAVCGHPLGLKHLRTIWKEDDTHRSLRVFLCHSSNDKKEVVNLYNRLCSNTNIDPWLDTMKLLPGQDWEFEIKKAIQNSDVVIVCLSKTSISKEGFVQKEIINALNVAEEKPEGTIFIIPLKLDECQIPQRLKRWEWVNYFESNGYNKLMHALQHRADQLEI